MQDSFDPTPAAAPVSPVPHAENGNLAGSPAPVDSAQVDREIKEIASIAKRLQVELDETAARQWILAMSAAERESAFYQDAQTGVFGHRIALMDFDASDLEYFRRTAQKVRAARRPNVESAIAIAGSSAQGKVQFFPGDVDFFERVNIKAANEAEARAQLREMVRETAQRAFAEPGIVLVEVNLGTYPKAVLERGVPRAKGDSITWTPSDVLKGYIEVQEVYGAPIVYTWDEAHAGVGWTYLGWIVADAEKERIALVSNMLDVTWEAPDGKITALDGAIDPFFQEIYLEPDAVNVFRKVIGQVDNSAMNAYRNAMRWQALHYTKEEPNFGKAAKRLYNLFRLTDELEAAAYVRELFNDPGAALYQVPTLLDAVDIAHRDETCIDKEMVLKQIDQVILAVVAATEASDEADIVLRLLRMRDDVSGIIRAGASWPEVLEDVRGRCSELVNEYFRTRLFGLPRIESFIAELGRGI